MPNSQQQQIAFFQQVKQHLPEVRSLASWLSNMLNIDQSNAYRRISGEIELSFSEYLRICECLPQAGMFAAGVYQSSSLVQGNLAYFNDWDSLYKYLENVVATVGKLALQQHQLFYVARDLPLFFFYSSPELMCYKFNLWLRSSGKGDTGEVPEKIIHLGEELYRVYQRMNTKELWYSWSFLNQLEQLKYWKSMDYLSNEELLQICESLIRTLNDYEQWLENGQKRKGGNLEIAILEFCTMNNGGLLQSEDGEMLMSGFQGINFLNTTSAPAINLFKDHWERHMLYAQSVTAGNTKARYQYFKKLRNAIDEVREWQKKVEME